ncbi:hypothetical protein FBU31_000639 [Coemansia sp. 'formosensis']|nr:hypothetical protein FBU31_000639 [Coemansia sp. 'formosensis']
MAMACFFVFAILTFSTALQFSQPNYPFQQTQRLLTTAMDHLGTNLVWWAIMGEPLFNSLFRKRKYLEYWTAKLKKDGLQNEYEIGSSIGNSANNLTYEDDDIFFFTEPTQPTPTYLPNGEPRPPSGHKRRAKFAPNRRSDMTGMTKRHSIIPPIVSKMDNYGDPFDIPPMTPTTAVNSPKSEDPFQLFSTDFRPPTQVNPSVGRPTRALRNSSTQHAQESQTVLPRTGSAALSVESIPDQRIVGRDRRWSLDSSTDDEYEYEYARSPTNRHII